MVLTDKSGSRRRVVVGWREVKRKVSDNKSRHRSPPLPVAKPQA